MTQTHVSLMRKALMVAAAAAGALVVGGCSGYKDPSIKTAGVSLAEVSDEALALRFTVDLANPNKEPLKLLEFDYSVTVDGVKVYEGMRAAETTLAAQGSKQVQIPAVIRFDRMKWTAGALPGEIRYKLRGDLQYVTPGEIAQTLFDTGVRRPSVGFSHEGKVLLKQ